MPREPNRDLDGAIAILRHSRSPLQLSRRTRGDDRVRRSDLSQEPGPVHRAQPSRIPAQREAHLPSRVLAMQRVHSNPYSGGPLPPPADPPPGPSRQSRSCVSGTSRALRIGALRTLSALHLGAPRGRRHGRPVPGAVPRFPHQRVVRHPLLRVLARRRGRRRLGHRPARRRLLVRVHLLRPRARTTKPGNVRACNRCGTPRLFEWLYLGYYIAESPKMRYKADYRPQERFVDGRWAAAE